jgi:arylsulfatase A-like enzyme
MHMRAETLRFPNRVVLAVCVCAVIAAHAITAAAAELTSDRRKRPNFVVILADDLGVGDVGAYQNIYPGGEDTSLAHFHTPNIDRLAEDGILCRQAYATGWCAPSRQMLLSGQWVNRPRAYDHPWIGRQLRNAGYVTAMVGKSHGRRAIQKTARASKPETAEFDTGLFFNGGMRSYYLTADDHFPSRRELDRFTYHAQKGQYITDVFTRHGVQFIERNADHSFMLYMSYTAPHRPLEGKPADLRKLFPDTFADMSDAEIRAQSRQKKRKNPRLAQQHYAAMVHALDRGVARLKDALRQEGVLDETTIIVTSDNGAIEGSNHPFQGHKWDGLEGGIRVPFIVWSQRIVQSNRSGSVYDGLVSLADITPTLIGRATEQPYPHPTDGTNLWPALTGQNQPPAGRRYFWSNASKKFHLSGIPGFGTGNQEKIPRRVLQAVLVRGNRKILAYNPSGTPLFGAVRTELPNVVGHETPAQLMREPTPIAGRTPPRDSPLYRELLRRLSAPPRHLLPEWSGAPNPDAFQWHLRDAPAGDS